MGLGMSRLRLGLTSGGGGLTPNFYVSMTGNDLNDGLTPATAFRTVSKANEQWGAGTVIAFERGGYWREEVQMGSNAFAAVMAYGDDQKPLPTFDSADVASSWTKTTGRTNVYETSWTHSMTKGSVIHRAWEDGQILTYVADVATCDSTEGSYTYTSSATTSPLTIYVHATGGGDPAANGRVYEITRRRWGVRGTGRHQIAQQFHATRNGHNDGAVALYGANGTIRNFLVTRGNKHHAFIWADGGKVENAALYLVDRAVTADWTMLVGYHHEDRTTPGVSYRNIYARYAEADADVTGPGFLGTAIYNHTAGAGSPIIGEVSVDWAYTYGCIKGISTANAITHRVTNSWIEQCRKNLSGGSVQVFDNIEIHSNNADMGFGQTQIVDGGGQTSCTVTDLRSSAAGTNVMFDVAAGCDLTIRNSTVLAGKTFDASTVLGGVEIHDSVIRVGRDVRYDDVVSSSGNVWQTDAQNFVRDAANYADVAALQAAFPALEVNSVESASFPAPSTISAARSFASALPPEADTGGRVAGSRKSIAAPDWDNLKLHWNAGYLGFTGASLGPELVTNGGFDADSDWSKDSWTIGSGVASLATVSGFDALSQNLSFDDGAWVFVSLEVTDRISGNLLVFVGTEGSNDARVVWQSGSTTLGAKGTYKAAFRHIDGQMRKISIRALNGFTGSIDNVSVRQIT